MLFAPSPSPPLPWEVLLQPILNIFNKLLKDNRIARGWQTRERKTGGLDSLCLLSDPPSKSFSKSLPCCHSHCPTLLSEALPQDREVLKLRQYRSHVQGSSVSMVQGVPSPVTGAAVERAPHTLLTNTNCPCEICIHVIHKRW